MYLLEFMGITRLNNKPKFFKGDYLDHELLEIDEGLKTVHVVIL